MRTLKSTHCQICGAKVKHLLTLKLPTDNDIRVCYNCHSLCDEMEFLLWGFHKFYLEALGNIITLYVRTIQGLRHLEGGKNEDI